MKIICQALFFLAGTSRQRTADAETITSSRVGHPVTPFYLHAGSGNIRNTIAVEADRADHPSASLMFDQTCRHSGLESKLGASIITLPYGASVLSVRLRDIASVLSDSNSEARLESKHVRHLIYLEPSQRDT